VIFHRPDLQLVARPVGVEDALVSRHRVRIGKDGARDPIAVADDVQRPGADVRDPRRERELELARPWVAPDDVVIGEQLLVGHEFRKEGARSKRRRAARELVLPSSFAACDPGSNQGCEHGQQGGERPGRDSMWPLHENLLRYAG
jgi:hypothetical protein